VLSPIEKCRLHVEESSKIVIAKTERKICCPEDLIVRNGFKLSGYYTDQPCLVPNCKDPACVFGHTCTWMSTEKWVLTISRQASTAFLAGKSATTRVQLKGGKPTAQTISVIIKKNSRVRRCDLFIDTVAALDGGNDAAPTSFLSSHPPHARLHILLPSHFRPPPSPAVPPLPPPPPQNQWYLQAIPF